MALCKTLKGSLPVPVENSSHFLPPTLKAIVMANATIKARASIVITSPLLQDSPWDLSALSLAPQMPACPQTAVNL